MDKLRDLLLKTAPALGTVIGGPLGGAAISILAEVFDVKPEPDAVADVIKSSDPEVVKASLARAEAAFKAEAERAITLRQQITSYTDMARLDYAKGSFHSMWRPAAGWIAVTYGGLFCYLAMYQAYLGNYVLLTMAPQVLMIGAPIMALAGVYAWGRSQEKVAYAQAPTSIVDVVKDYLTKR